MVLAVCRRVLGDDHAAEDAFQASFLVLARKAGSAGWHESIGSWLYQVTYRVAKKAKSDAARRQLHERQVPEMATADADAAALRHELRAVLDEELTRLPEKYRAPLVLCYLEGKTNEEAAAQLGWTKGTVSGRLARARDLLRGRLARRGLALSVATLPATLAETAGAAPVPATLLSNTIKAATAGTVAGPIAALAEGVLQTMFLTRLKIASIVLLVLGAVGTGILTYRALAEGKGKDLVAATIPLPEPERTKTKAKPEEKTIASKPVRVNGVDFQVVTERRWMAPDPAADSRPIELGLRITNRTAEELHFLAVFQVHIKLPDGREVNQFLGADNKLEPARVKLAAGKSTTLQLIRSRLLRDPAQKELRWWGNMGAESWCGDKSLESGQKYYVSLSYAPMTTDKNEWQGKVCTAEVPVEVVDPPFAKVPLPENTEAKRDADAQVVVLEIKWTSGVLTAKGTYGLTYGFRVKKDGSFQYDGKPFGKYDGKPFDKAPEPLKGKLPKGVTESLIELIATAKSPGPQPATPGVVASALHCSWLDKSGKPQKKQFPWRDPNSDGQAVQKQLDELARKYGDKKENK